MPNRYRYVVDPGGRRRLELRRADAPATAANAGTAAEVLAWVGDDPEYAAAALETERNADKPRKTLISKLEAIANG